ncbi:MAG: PAS domain-containing protein [Eubacterium sp.]|nr:PAS domain-containing protein [Eubacterium sp.]
MKKVKHIYNLIYTVVVIGLFIIFVSIVNRGIRVYREEYSKLSASRADMASNFISSYLTSYTNTISGLADMEITQKGLSGGQVDLTGLANIVSTGNLTSDYVENVIFLTEDMDIVLSAQPIATGLSEDDTEWIKKAAFGTYISDAVNDSFENQEYFIVAVPVFYNKLLVGYIASKISFSVFSVTHGDLTDNSDDSFILFDSAGNAVQLNTGESSEYTYRDLTAEGNMPKDKYFISESKIFLNGEDSSWKIFYILSGEKMYNSFNRLFGSLFAACLAMLFIGFLAEYIYKKYFVRPVNIISAALDDMNGNKNYSVITEKTGQENFDGIIAKLNEMIEDTISGEAAINIISKRYYSLFIKRRIIFIKWDLLNSSFDVSPYYKEIFGIDFISYVGKDFTPGHMNIHPEDVEKYNQWIKDIRLGRKIQPLVYRRKVADGKYRYFEHTFVINNDDMGNPVEALGFIVDVNKFARKEIALRRAAELDRYTGAYNKYSFMEILKSHYEEAASEGGSLCVSLVKLHNFYELEDKKIGAGEEALRFIVNVMTENIDCVVGRILTDSLGIIGSPQNVTFFADEIAKELELGFTFPETDEHFNIKTTAAIFLTEKFDKSFDNFIR